jgi:hypothetical protein
MEYVEKVSQLSPQNIITNAMTLLSSLSYAFYKERYDKGVPWLNEENVIKNAAGRADGKVADELKTRIDSYVQSFSLGRGSRGTASSVFGWWKNAPSIEQRDLYICLPLQSPPIEPEDIELFKDRPPRQYKDPLDITKKSMADTKRILDELGISKRSYIVFIDDLWRLPAPVEPEKWSEDAPRLESIPEPLREYFDEHVCHSKMILDAGRTIERMKTRIQKKNMYNVELNRRELSLGRNEEEFKEKEPEFRRKLLQDIRITRSMTDLQLKEFWHTQIGERKLGEDCWVYFVGAVVDLGSYAESLQGRGWNSRIYWLKPLDGVSDTNSQHKVVNEGLVTAKRTMDRLKGLIEETALKTKPELVEKPQRTLGGF